MEKQVKLALVDDHTLFRKGLVQLIRLIDEQQFRILFEARNGKAMISQLNEKELPDIIIMDIDMPGMGGFDAVHWLRSNHPQIKILVVSMIETEESIIRMVKMGVKGYLSKDIELEDLQAALYKIGSGNIYYTDFITGRLIGSLQSGILDGDARHVGTGKDMLPSNAWSKLKEREQEFVRLACSDLTFDQIAGEMVLAPKTIEGYASRVYEKMGVKTRLGLVITAFKHRLVDL